MEKLDRLVWATGISVQIFGLEIGIRVSVPELLDRALDRLPWGWEPSSSEVVERLYSLISAPPLARPGVRNFHLAYADANRLARSHNLEGMLDAFEWHVGAFLAMNAQDSLFVHAGVVGWEGKAIVIPGRSFSGKTTLVEEFLRAGAVYYSDEFAVLDEKGRVHPFPRALGIRKKDLQMHIAPQQLGCKTGSEPLPVGMVLLTRYRADARWRPKPASRGTTALSLLANSFAARNNPERALAIFGKAVEGASALKGIRGEARTVVDSVLETMHANGAKRRRS